MIHWWLINTIISVAIKSPEGHGDIYDTSVLFSHIATLYERSNLLCRWLCSRFPLRTAIDSIDDLIDVIVDNYNFGLALF